MTITLDRGAWVHSSVVFGGSARIGFTSCLGQGAMTDVGTFIADGVDIGAFCVISLGVHIGAQVEIDHYCRISKGVRIGARTRVLYRAQVFDDVTIGDECIIAGELVDRTVIGNEVTFQGSTAHSHRDPTGDWDLTEEPSPVILDGSVVGVGAIIIGGIRIGPRAYIAAGEVVRCDVPRETVLEGGKIRPLAEFRGVIKVRGS